MAFNTNLADAKEFEFVPGSAQAQVEEKDRRHGSQSPGFPTGLLQFTYYHPELGCKYEQVVR